MLETEALESRDTWCPFLWFPDLQSLIIVVIILMMLMTVILSMAKVVKTGKMRNLVFEIRLFKLSFPPVSFSFYPLAIIGGDSQIILNYIMFLDVRDCILNHRFSAKVSWHTHLFIIAMEYFKISFSV